MADLGLEERWKALGDAVDAWLDRLTDPDAAECWRAVSGSADPEGDPAPQPRAMARVVRRTLRRSRAERAEIRERAAALGMSVLAELSVELDPALTVAPALALSEAEQRRLLDRVDRLVESMLSAASTSATRRAAISGWASSAAIRSRTTQAARGPL